MLFHGVADPGCLSRIRIFLYPGSEFFYPGSASKNFSPKKIVSKPRKYDLGCSSRIWIRTFYPSRILDLGVTKAPDPESGSVTLPFHIKNVDLLFLLDICRQLQRRSGAAGPRTLHPSPQLLRLQRQEGDVRLPCQQCYW
jgi:hypothetical protein